jgi:iron complex outermembrane recepter protein
MTKGMSRRRNGPPYFGTWEKTASFLAVASSSEDLVKENSDLAEETLCIPVPSMRTRLTNYAGLLLLIVLLSSTCLAKQPDLTDLSLEDLANVKVTSVSRKTENLFGAPAAIFVLTGEDIRRGGFTRLPEALRMVPGLYVVQINPHSWQISARGFADLNNDKMLVLVDGRSVYTPLYGGIYWDALDTPVEDIERVEVIRGPGGTLWGANAVNGVINIVTKGAQQTQGWLVSTSADVNLGETATVQYGGQVGNVKYRIFGKSSYWGPFNSSSGVELPDNFNLTQAGVRADWAASDKDGVSFEGGTYDGRFRNTETFSPIRTSDLLKGSHLLVHWKHTISDRSNFELLTYCDWYTRQGTAGEKRNRCDIEFQHSHEFNKRNSLIWGGSFLSTGDYVTPDNLVVVPDRRRSNAVSGFAQYEYVIVPNRLRILAGSKIEHNAYSGFEYQPQVRVAWTPNKLNTVWTSIARAVSSPSRVESDVKLVVPGGVANGVPFYIEVDGNPGLQSERVKAYELGYRYQPASTLSFDFALFYNDYNNLIISTAPAYVSNSLPLVTYANGGRAETHGAELSVKWRPLRRWTLSPSVTELRGSPDAALANPRHQFNVQSRVDLPHRLEFDSGLYYYSALPVQVSQSIQVAAAGVSAFERVDVGLAWHATAQWTFAVWGRNLQSRQHVESLPSILVGPAGEVPRSVSFKVMWQQKVESADK